MSRTKERSDACQRWIIEKLTTLGLDLSTINQGLGGKIPRVPLFPHWVLTDWEGG